MAISRVMSTQSETTNSRSAARVETPRDSPDIHWTLNGILERHFWKQTCSTDMLMVNVIHYLLQFTVPQSYSLQPVSSRETETKNLQYAVDHLLIWNSPLLPSIIRHCSVLLETYHQVFIYLQVSSESDGEKQHQYREGRTVRHSHLKITGRGVKTNHLHRLSLMYVCVCTVCMWARDWVRQ